MRLRSRTASRTPECQNTWTPEWSKDLHALEGRVDAVRPPSYPSICVGGVGAGGLLQLTAGSPRARRLDRGLDVVPPIGWPRQPATSPAGSASRRRRWTTAMPPASAPGPPRRVPLHVSNRRDRGCAPLRPANRLIPFWIHRPPGAVPAVEPLRVRQRQPADERSTASSVCRPEHEVPVIRHDAVGEQPSRPDGLASAIRFDERAIAPQRESKRVRPAAARLVTW